MQSYRKSLPLATMLLCAAGAFAQNAQVPPVIIDGPFFSIVRDGGNDFFNRGLIASACPDMTFEPFDPATQVADELDLILVGFTIFDPDLGDDQENGAGGTAEEELYLLVDAIWTPFSAYFAPEPPPMPGTNGFVEGTEGDLMFEEVFGRPVGENERQICYGVVIPRFNGRNQARLRGFIDYDVAWTVFFFVSNDESPEDGTGGFDGAFFDLRALKDPKFLGPNPPPIADAGSDQRVVAGSTVTLDGSMSVDGSNTGFDPNSPFVLDDETLSYTWEWLSGPTRVDPIYPNPTTRPAEAEVTLSQVGTYVFRLIVDDPVNDLPSSDTVTIEVVSAILDNRKPVARIEGPEAASVVGDIVQLSGSNSTDPDGDPLEFRWVQTNEIGGPVDSSLFRNAFQPLSGLDEPVSSWQALAPGTYHFRLIVDDGEFFDTARTSVRVVATAAEAAVAGVSQPGNAATRDPANDDSGDATAQPNVVAPACGAAALPLAAVGLTLAALRRRPHP